MKDDEIRFFKTCWRLRLTRLSVRDIISIVQDFIPAKRCYWLLKKWTRFGIYDYGVTLDLGWFCPDAMPERYRDLAKEVECDAGD